MSKTERISRPESWRREFIRANGTRCHYCNRTGHLDMGPDERPWWVDHMKPIARGGPDTEDNLVLACKRCNLTKGVRPYEQFKAFARAAFWVPDDWRVSEGNLDELMSLHSTLGPASQVEDDDDPTWHLDADRKRITAIGKTCLGELVTTPVLHLSEEVARDGNPRCRDYVDGKDILRFILKTRELLPSLIAEVRMLRGETEQAEEAA